MAVAVVTVCRDPGEAILATAASLAGQSAPVRWLVVDGASTDGTPERLRALPRAPDLLISEADGGIAEAFNKGLALADADDVLFLNAGDRFTGPEALSLLSGGWDRRRFHWAVGGVRVCDEHGRQVGIRRPRSGVTARSLVSRGNRIPHPAVLAPAPLLRSLGGFDPRFRFSMDYDLWLRAIAAGHAPQVVEVEVAEFLLGGRSSDVRARMSEDRRARIASGLSDGVWAEAWLTIGGWARMTAAPLRRSAWAYRLNRMLGW